MIAITAVTLLLIIAGALAIVYLRRGLDRQTRADIEWIAKNGGIE
jgi:hypothetical protein